MKLWMKRAGILLLVLVLFAAIGQAFGDGEEATKEPVQEEKKTGEPETPIEEVEEGVTEEETAEEPIKEEETVDNSALEQVALSLIEENFADTGTVSYDEEYKTYVITPTDPQFTLEVLEVLDNGKGIESWNAMADGLATLSGTMSELLGEGYMLAVANPLNVENMLMILSEGEIVYDAINQ